MLYNNNSKKMQLRLLEKYFSYLYDFECKIKLLTNDTEIRCTSDQNTVGETLLIFEKVILK